MTELKMKPDVKMIRVKTVREVKMAETSIDLWHPPSKSNGAPECKCVRELFIDGMPLCRDCYGTDISGGYEGTLVVNIRDVSYEEVMDAGGERRRWEDDYTFLTFECDLGFHIFYGCLFLFDDRQWKVVGVEQKEEDEDDDGNFLLERWAVSARNLEKWEGASAFLTDQGDKRC